MRFGLLILFLITSISVMFIVCALPTIIFVSPTLDNNSYTNNNWVFVNLTSDENLNQSLLEWGNSSGFTNISIDNSSLTNWYKNLTSLTDYNYNYIILAQNISGDWSQSARYFVTVDTINPQINFTDSTPSNDSTQNNTNIFVNVSTSDLHNISAFIDFDNSLVGWWRFSESSLNNGSSLEDFSGYGIDGTVYANDSSGNSRDISTSNGYFGRAGDFDGADDYVDCGVQNLFPNSSGAISVWIKPQGTGFREILTQDRYKYLELRIDASNKIQLYSDSNFLESSTALTNGQWYHIVAQYNGSDAFIYLNGELDNSSAKSMNFSLANNRKLYIGRSSSGYYFNGTIDDVIIFNRSLNADEVIGLYANKSSEYLEKNFTSLSEGTHTFKAYTQDIAGNVNETELRQVTIGSITIDYPYQYVTYQRFNSTTGEILISGSYSGEISSVEARFIGGNWEVIDNSPSNNLFQGRLNASVGQGLLEVRSSNNVAINSSVNQIGIGDIYVAYGQSNSAGWGQNPQVYNTSLIYNATAFNRTSGLWGLGTDPISTVGRGSSPYPLIANFLVQNQSIPISFISTAPGGVAITSLTDGTSNYNSMISNINTATNGTMRVKSMLYFQGESDTRTDSLVNGSYQNYLNNLTALVDGFIRDTEIADKVMVGQIGNYATLVTRENIDNIRRVQQDTWNLGGNFTNSGPITYDIAHSVDSAHFYTDAEMAAFADRWDAAIFSVFYGGNESNPPEIVNITMNASSSDTFILNINESSLPLKIQFWNETNSSIVYGWYINNSGTILNDSDIVSTNLTGTKLEVTLNQNISNNAKISFASLNDAHDKPVIVDSSSFNLPLMPFYSQTITYTIPPNIVFKSPTPEDESNQSNTNIYINVSVTDSLHNISTFIDFDNSLVGWWRFSESSLNNGSSLEDFSGYGIDGTVYANDSSGNPRDISTSDGYFGRAGDFDGADDYVDCGVQNLFPNSSGAISVWIKPQGTGFRQILTQDRYNYLELRVDSANKIQLFSGGGEIQYHLDSVTALTNGQWYHVVAQYNGSDAFIYLNGELDNSSAKSMNFSLANNRKLYIGKSILGYYFNGTIDDVIIFNRSLNADEVIGLYANKSSEYLEKNFTSLSEGTHTFKAYTQDIAGNVNETEERSVVIDTTSSTPPTTTTTETSGSGTPTYYPTETNLQEGYSKQLSKNWKLKFEIGDESHELKIDEIDKINKTATVTVSSESQTKTLSVGEEWKVNLDSDDYYDLLVRLENITFSRANVFIQEINEAIEVVDNLISGDVVGDEIVGEVESEDRNYFYIVCGIVLVLGLFVVAFLIGRKYLKRK